MWKQKVKEGESVLDQETREMENRMSWQVMCELPYLQTHQMFEGEKKKKQKTVK